MASDKVVTITKENWQSAVIESDLPVLVDFWAEWCGPCKAIGPVLDELSEELDGKLTIAKVNVDDNPDLAQQFGVRSIPTLLVMKKGEEVDKMVGASSKGQLKEKLDAHI